MEIIRFIYQLVKNELYGRRDATATKKKKRKKRE